MELFSTISLAIVSIYLGSCLYEYVNSLLFRKQLKRIKKLQNKMSNPDAG